MLLRSAYTVCRVSEINFTGTQFGQHFTLPLTWQVDGGNLTLTKDQPLNTNGPNTTVALKLQDGQTVANYGFWGIPINAGNTYELTYWVNNQNVSLILISIVTLPVKMALISSKILQQLIHRSEAKVIGGSCLALPCLTCHLNLKHEESLMQEGVPGLTIELQSSDGSQSLSDAPPSPKAMPQGEWTKQHVTLTASTGSYKARLAVTAAAGTSILLDQVSLWPSQNGPEGSISPFRPDLLQMVVDLKPRCCLLPLTSCAVQVPAGSVLWNNRHPTNVWWFAGLCASPEAASVSSLPAPL